jgi:hypothetical protein
MKPEIFRRTAALGTLALLASCGGNDAPSGAEVPGGDTTARTKVLEAGADLLQAKPPLRALDAYLDGFHFESGNPAHQMEAHHYCGHLGEDVIQCVIFDGNASDAKIMGVEYIVSRAVFEKLPAEEKNLWHSHVHEVRSGQLVAPGIPEVAQRALMEKIAGTYGKTWHTWHTDAHRELPLGAPALMMGFTQDGQIDEQLVAARDQRLSMSTAAERARRADLPYPVPDAAADAWQKGEVRQLRLEAAPARPPAH